MSPGSARAAPRSPDTPPGQSSHSTRARASSEHFSQRIFTSAHLVVDIKSVKPQRSEFLPTEALDVQDEERFHKPSTAHDTPAWLALSSAPARPVRLTTPRRSTAPRKTPAPHSVARRENDRPGAAAFYPIQPFGPVNTGVRARLAAFASAGTFCRTAR